MKKILVATSLLLSTIAIAEEQVNMPVPCYDAKRFWQEASDLYKETIDFSYDNEGDQNTTKIAFLSNKTKGTWTLIRYDKYLVCVIGYGKFQAV